MKLIHISDVHIGYRAYSKINESGINVREADVFAAFKESFETIARLQPDVILITGDLFHVVRPSNLMIEQTFKEFLALRRQTDVPIVVIGGNHDTPRSLETGCILDLLSNIPDFHVVHSGEKVIRFDYLDTSVLCIPHRALEHLDSISLQTDHRSKYNILALHAAVEGIFYAGSEGVQISRSSILNSAWDYIALGHYHSFTKIAENACYSGSVEYTSTNIWSETAVSKGFIEYNLAKRELTAFHKIKTRSLEDLRTIDAAEFTAEQVMKAVRNRVGAIPGGCDDKIIRLVVENIPRQIQKDLDFAFIREVRSKALHFDFQMKRPNHASRNASADTTGAARSIEAEWRDYAGSVKLPAGVEREKLLDLGLLYMQAGVLPENL